MSALQRRVQLIEEDLEKTEERLNQATTKLNEASQAADESERYFKVKFHVLFFFSSLNCILFDCMV